MGSPDGRAPPEAPPAGSKSDLQGLKRQLQGLKVPAAKNHNRLIHNRKTEMQGLKGLKCPRFQVSVYTHPYTRTYTHNTTGVYRDALQGRASHIWVHYFRPFRPFRPCSYLEPQCLLGFQPVRCRDELVFVRSLLVPLVPASRPFRGRRAPRWYEFAR